MNGLMMNMPLMISSLIRHAAHFNGDTEIVSRLTEGGFHRYTYAAAERRARQMARALQALDTLLAIYTGDQMDALTQVSANDNNGSSLRSLVQFTASAGTTYHIAVYRSQQPAILRNVRSGDRAARRLHVHCPRQCGLPR